MTQKLIAKQDVMIDNDEYFSSSCCVLSYKNLTMQHTYPYRVSVQFITAYLSLWKGQQCELSGPV